MAPRGGTKLGGGGTDAPQSRGPRSAAPRGRSMCPSSRCLQGGGGDLGVWGQGYLGGGGRGRPLTLLPFLLLLILLKVRLLLLCAAVEIVPKDLLGTGGGSEGTWGRLGAWGGKGWYGDTGMGVRKGSDRHGDTGQPGDKGSLGTGWGHRRMDLGTWGRDAERPGGRGGGTGRTAIMRSCCAGSKSPSRWLRLKPTLLFPVRPCRRCRRALISSRFSFFSCFSSSRFRSFSWGDKWGCGGAFGGVPSVPSVPSVPHLPFPLLHPLPFLLPALIAASHRRGDAAGVRLHLGVGRGTHTQGWGHPCPLIPSLLILSIS